MLGRESFALPFQSPIAFLYAESARRGASFCHRHASQETCQICFKSRLDEVEGIGSRRKHDLLNYFGSVEEISQASIKDIEKVEGISKKNGGKDL